MNRLIFTFIMLSIVVSLNAQFKIDPPITLEGSGITIIPKEFCKSNTPLIVVKESWKFIVYDDNLSLVRTFSYPIERYPKELTYIDYDEGKYFNDTKNNSVVEKFKITQTLFNDDEKFEYIAADYLDPNNTDTWGTYVFNEDGEVVEKLELDGELKLIMKINGNFYLVTSSPYRFYKINKTSKSENNSSTNSQSFSGDVNGDGVVDAADVVKVTNIIMGE